MARIIGGIGTSHVPTIGLAYDRKKQNDPAWAPLFAGYEPVARWLTEKQPDVLVYFYNDHATTFFFDHYPTFALGIGERFPIADEGLSPRALPAIRSHPALARHLAQSLVNDEFDISIFQDLPLDHGCNSPLTMLWGHEPDWPGALIPFAINVLQHPLPTALRCYKLGQAMRRAILSYPEDLAVVVVGTGGLSHQMSGERAGFNNAEWDAHFLDLIERDPHALAVMTHADYARLGGTEGAEEIMWLAMRGALSDGVRKLHQSYYLPMTTAMAVALFEEPAEAGCEPPAVGRSRNPQLAGIEALPGTHLFDLERSARGLRLNRFLHGLIAPENRHLFQADAELAFARAGLTEEERVLLRTRDWLGLIRYGASFFTLEKLARVSGISNPEMVAAMRGESLAAFLATRNVPAAR